MTKFKVNDMESFDPEEQTHITNLKIRAEKLQGYKNGGGKVGSQLLNELAALEWVFEVLNEISEED